MEIRHKLLNVKTFKIFEVTTNNKLFADKNKIIDRPIFKTQFKKINIFIKKERVFKFNQYRKKKREKFLIATLYPNL